MPATALALRPSLTTATDERNKYRVINALVGECKGAVELGEEGGSGVGKTDRRCPGHQTPTPSCQMRS